MDADVAVVDFADIDTPDVDVGDADAADVDDPAPDASVVDFASCGTEVCFPVYRALGQAVPSYVPVADGGRVV